MKPRAFLDRMKKGRPGAGYLFLGRELYYRDACRRALIQAALGVDSAAAASADALIEIDLREQSLQRLLDETRTMSLFASARVVYGYNAEAALPRLLTSVEAKAQMGELARYFKNPSPGVTVVIESTRFDPNERDDKAKFERVQKFYGSAPEAVDLDRLSEAEAVRAAEVLAQRLELKVERETLAELVDLLGTDMLRIRQELEKLKLYGAEGETIGQAEVEMLVPEARQRGAFELTEALAAKDRRRALEILDTLAKSGSYWPMQVTLLAGMFRHALAVKESGARNSNDVMRSFREAGIRIWPARAQQLLGTARQFRKEELEMALVELYRADWELRDLSPEDRITMERLVLKLTA